MSLNLIELWSKMGLPVKAVVFVLTIQAIASLTVIIDRLMFLRRAKKTSTQFAKPASELLMKREFPALKDLAEQMSHIHLAVLFRTGVASFLDAVSRGASRTDANEIADRAITRKQAQVSSELYRGMNVLASTGSTAPFVGLLGTVLGIINAFHLIGENDSGGLGTIGSAIGEALVVTGYGLCVAIPVVLLFNWMTAKLGAHELALSSASGELSDAFRSYRSPSHAHSDSSEPPSMNELDAELPAIN